MDDRLYRILVEVAKDRGIFVVDDEPFPPTVGETVDGLYTHRSGQDFIAVNPKLALEAKVAVLAHELGHYALHRGTMDQVRYWDDSGYRSRKEAEADRFARALLRRIQRRVSTPGANDRRT